MLESLILIEGQDIREEQFRSLSLSNAKQLVVGSQNRFGIILHIAANSSLDMEKALLEITQVDGVSSVLTLAIKRG